MVTAQAKTTTFSFSPRYRKQILDLAKHREPGYPSFLTLTLMLVPVNDESQPIWTTMWYVGKAEESNGRYHVQFAGESEVIPAVLDESQQNLRIIER